MAEIRGGDKLDAALAAIAKRVGKGGVLQVGFVDPQAATEAFFNNYGTSTAPARPFFSNMIEDKSPGWGPALAACLEATGNDVAGALDLLGEGIANQLRAAIVDFQGVPLSKVTLLLRQRFPMRDGMTEVDVWQAFRDVAAGVEPGSGHANQLVWSGHMLNSVIHRVIPA